MKENDREFAEHIFHVPTPLEHALGIWLRTTGHTNPKPIYSIGPKTISYFSLHMVISGRLWFKTPEQTFELYEGDIFCMFPGEVYEYGYAVSAQPLRMYWASFHGPNAGLLIEQTKLTKAFPVRRGRGGVDAAYPSLFKRIFTQARSKDTNLSLTAALTQLLCQLAINDTSSPSHKPKPDWVTSSTSFMEMHYKENISIEQVADWVGLTRSHFSKYFTLHKGISPAKYILELRMKEAKRLLQNTRLTITEIAYSLGYNDLYSFSRSFKQHTAITPTDFRDTKFQK